MPTKPYAQSKELNRTLGAALWAHPELAACGSSVVDTGHWFDRTQDTLLFVEAGRLDTVVQVDDQGSHVIPVSFGAGEFALLSNLFSRERQTGFLVAAMPSKVRVVPKEVLEHLLVEHKDMLVLLVRFLSRRLTEVRARERGWLEKSVQGRVRAVLARMALDDPPSAGAPWLIAETHEHLAMRCGISRSKVSLELKQLERAGVLRLRRGAIEVLDHAGLGHMPPNP